MFPVLDTLQRFREGEGGLMEPVKRVAGERIYLAPMDMDDAPNYIRWLNDPETFIFLQANGQVFNKLNEEQFLMGVMERGEPHFSIRLCETDKHIGGCGLINLDWVNRRGELGIMIGEAAYRNQGYGQEAIKLLLDHAFYILNLNSVSLIHYEFNRRAARCYHKCGFKKAGRLRKARLINGQFFDIIVMDILARDHSGGLFRQHLNNIIVEQNGS